MIDGDFLIMILRPSKPCPLYVFCDCQLSYWLLLLCAEINTTSLSGGKLHLLHAGHAHAY